MQHFPTRGLRSNGSPAADEDLSDGDMEAIADAVRLASDDVRHDGLEAVLSRAHVGILHRDLTQHVLLVNDAFCAMIGRSAAELEGLSFDKFTHPDDAERSSIMYLTHFAQASAYEIEKRYVRPDGTVVWCTVYVSFVLDAEGRPQSTIFITSDVTARRTAELELRESEEHYRYTVELNPQIAWTADPDGAILDVSSRWEEITGIPKEEAIGGNWQWLAALHPEDVPHARRAWSRSVASKTPVDIEYRLRTQDNAFRWMRAHAAPRLDALGNVVRWYGTLEDIHARKVAQNALLDSEERFRLAAEAAGLGIWDYDAVRGRREWSDEFKAMLGLDRDAAPKVETALSLVVPQDRHLLQALVDAVEAGDSSARFEVTLRINRADNGVERWMRTAGWRMHAPSGRLERVLVTIRDVTEERTAEERIRWTATHDSLTGLPNRAFFTEQMDAAIARATLGGSLALVLLDVDHLKEVNDTIGHDAGDVLLTTFASRLRQVFGDDAVLGRLGGDEFAVLLEGEADQDMMPRVVEALGLLREPFEYAGHSCDTQATAGASIYPMHGDSTADLLKAADLALYVGKNGRRGALSVFEPEMRADLQRRSSMLNVARIALRDDLVLPFYQPKVSLATGQVVGFEALLRWDSKCLGIQGPGTIASAFDDFGLAVALGDRMLTRIARDMRNWLDAGLDLGRIAINLSPAEFRHEQLVERVLEPFERLGVPLDRIELEITETVLLGRDTDRIAATLRHFHERGITIALDDFGTGFASLTHLKMFPVDVIKIDRSFIGNLHEGSEDAAIVGAVISLAHRLDIEVVAEGIEQEEQARYLRHCGCNCGQGYLFGRAVPADEASAIMAAPKG